MFFKSNHIGIETLFAHLPFVKILYFKSNHIGIETCVDDLEIICDTL